MNFLLLIILDCFVPRKDEQLSVFTRHALIELDCFVPRKDGEAVSERTSAFPTKEIGDFCYGYGADSINASLHFPNKKNNSFFVKLFFSYIYMWIFFYVFIVLLWVA